MKRIKEIYDNIDIVYKGVEINKLATFKAYGDFVCKVLDSEEKHASALLLNTGSEYYGAINLTLSAVACLFYNNTDILDLVTSLTIGTLLIIDGKRAKFLGIKNGKEIGLMHEKKYFIYESNSSIKFCPIDRLKGKDISVYKGSSERLDGRGVKSDFTKRKAFLSYFSGREQSEISTEIGCSVAVILERELVEDFYDNIKIFYGGNKSIKLSDLVTAAYYSDNDKYQLGNNPTKETPILRFYSKLSVCRDNIIDDKGQSIIGCILNDDLIWYNNSELESIINRRSLKFSLIAGRVHFTKYCDFFNKDYMLYAILPETIKLPELNQYNDINIKNTLHELSLFSKREIKEIHNTGDISTSEILEVKRRLLALKRDIIQSIKRDEFIVTCYFLLNLCRSAFFPLKFCDIAYEHKFIGWNLENKFLSIDTFIGELSGSQKENADYIRNTLHKMVDNIYEKNSKADIVKSKIMKEQIDCIVATKNYYDSIFGLWALSEGIEKTGIPRIMTASAFSKNRIMFNNVIFTTPYYDFMYNPYAECNFSNAYCMIYDYESGQAKSLKRQAAYGAEMLYDLCGVVYNNIIIDYKSDNVNEELSDSVEVDFELEIDRIAKELQLSNAYKYIRTEFGNSDSTVQISKIMTFASGNIGFFTKQFKGYRLSGESIDEVELENLKAGDSIVFTKESENKDIVDLLLNKLLERQYKNTSYPKYYELSVRWKNQIKEFININGYTLQYFVDRLKLFGCEKSYAAVRSWLTEESHIVGPVEESDYESILKAVNSDLNAAEVNKSCAEIRKLRRKILSLLGKAIISNIISGNTDPLWKEISERANDLSQVEQITSINDLDPNTVVSSYMINKPCAL